MLSCGDSRNWTKTYVVTTVAGIDWLEEIGVHIKGEWDGDIAAGTYSANMAEGTIGGWVSRLRERQGCS